jgi:hypothetical protein
VLALARSSFDQGQVHTVVLNNYIDWNQNTPQYNWCDLPRAPKTLTSMAMFTQLTVNLHQIRARSHNTIVRRFKMDMTKQLNRTATPWVIVMLHAPVYALSLRLRLVVL